MTSVISSRTVENSNPRTILPVASTRRIESDYLDYSRLKKITIGPGIETYSFEDDSEDDDETVIWDCDGCWELGDFEFDSEYEDDE